MRIEIVELQRAIEKARTVVWANEPACTLADVAVALVEAGSVLDAVIVDAIAALDASKEHKATGDFSPADLLRPRCRAKHDTVVRLQRAARRLRTMPHTAEAFAALARSVGRSGDAGTPRRRRARTTTRALIAERPALKR